MERAQFDDATPRQQGVDGCADLLRFCLLQQTLSPELQQPTAGQIGFGRQEQQQRCGLPALPQLEQFPLQGGRGHAGADAPDHQVDAPGLGCGARLELEGVLQQPLQPSLNQGLGKDQDWGGVLRLRHGSASSLVGAQVNGDCRTFQSCSRL